MSKKTVASFGRVEMNRLLGLVGGDDSEAGMGTAGTASFQGGRGFEPRKTKFNQVVDIASLTTAETAALLQHRQKSKGVSVTTNRHRADRSQNRMQHHELLEQELRAQERYQHHHHHQQQQQPQPQQQQQQKHKTGIESEEQTEFRTIQRRKKASNKRLLLYPHIIAQKEDAPIRSPRRIQRSSSCGSDNAGSASRRTIRARKNYSSSDSSKEAMARRCFMRSLSMSFSSSSEDDRRQRRLMRRKDLAEESKVKEYQVKDEKPLATSDATQRELGSKSKAIVDDALSRQTWGLRGPSSGSFSSGSSRFSSDSESSSSCGDETAPFIVKPLFVPKQKRLHLSREILEAERSLQEEKKKHEDKRKKESRALLAHVVSAGIASVNYDVVSDDEELLAKRMLDDKEHAEEKNKERDIWEVRELDRLLAEIDDQLHPKEQEAAEYRRRQQLTDMEARAEDIVSGRYQQPGSSGIPGDRDQRKYQQKYFHRGAFYLDEDEFNEDDVRWNAKDYAQGITESAKSRGDTRNLPKLMQSKQFGRAIQSSYQGLSKEDTRSRGSSTMLHLVHQQKECTMVKLPTLRGHQDQS